MRSPIYVTAFTRDTDYERHVSELRTSCDAFGLELEATAIPDVGCWAGNCAQKPRVVRDAMLRHGARPIVWLDADARVRRRPGLFDELALGEPAVDVGYHLWDGHQLASGTLYFGPTAAAARLVGAWHGRCVAEPGVWDQLHLERAVDAMRRQLVIAPLPIEYLAIFDAGVPTDGIVIEHLQASRTMRERIGQAR